VRIAAWATVEIVNVVLTALAPSVTVDELNVQLAIRGKPLQERLTGLVKAPCGVIIRVKVADCPSVMV